MASKVVALTSCLVVMMSSHVTFAVITDTGVDATRLPDGKGPDIVNAVVDVIRASCILPDDRQFLRRLAYVESLDGTKPDTYKDGYNGGIWKVNKNMFDATTSCSGVMAAMCQTIRTQLGIDWTRVTWFDLRKPLYSGLGAVLYLAQRGQLSDIPTSPEGQASVWSHYYHFGNPPIKNFTSIVEKASTYDCNDDMDLVFLLDSSGSIIDTDFNLSLSFVADIVQKLQVPSKVQVATIIYADSPSVQINFKSFSTKQGVINAVLTIPRDNGGTATDAALDAARTLVFTAQNGARPAGSVKRVVVLVTDGQSDSMALTSQAAYRLRTEAGATIFSIGVGSFSLPELQTVASDPVCTHVYTLPDYSRISSIISEIERTVCKAHTALTHGFVLTKNDTNVHHITKQDNGTVMVNVTCGTVNVFVSHTNPNPSAALYDYKFTAMDGNPAYVASGLSDGRPVYMTVQGKRLEPNSDGIVTCTNFQYQLSVNTEESLVQCCIGSSCRTCSNQELRSYPNIREIVCDSWNTEFPNPCTHAAMDAGHVLFPYPYDVSRFIRCDFLGNAYVTLCPQRKIFNPNTLTCGYSMGGELGTPLPTTYPNPCTPENIIKQYLYFAYTPNRHMYIHCDLWGDAFLVECPVLEVWSQSDQTCVADIPAHVLTTTKAASTIRNPCTPENIALGRMYHLYPCDHTRFIHCDITGQYWVQFCPGGLYYNPATYICGTDDVQHDEGEHCF